VRVPLLVFGGSTLFVEFETIYWSDVKAGKGSHPLWCLADVGVQNLARSTCLCS